MKLNVKTLIIAGAVVGAMAVEAVVMLMMSGGSKPVAGDASESMVDDMAYQAAQAGGDTIEERIDEFKCTNNLEESSLHLRFKVDAVIKENDKISFQEAVKAKKSRIRQTVEEILRRASQDDLNDPALNTMKRLIREDVNKVLGKSYITEAVIHDFSMIEQ